MISESAGQSQATDKRLLKVEDVAEQCSVSARTVRRWINGDGLPTHRLPGCGSRGILRVDAGELELWLARYQHDFAADGKSNDKTMRLNGRRFINDGKNRNRLDSAKNPASCVPTPRRESG
jgi:Helix-turn-helix domain